jgi:hypothetical protein
MRIGGRNKIMDSLINKYIVYLIATKKEFSKQLIFKDGHGKQNYRERGNEKVSGFKTE